nr:hypothetical protein [uncultured Capnocytophaga sp.]
MSQEELFYRIFILSILDKKRDTTGSYLREVCYFCFSFLGISKLLEAMETEGLIGHEGRYENSDTFEKIFITEKGKEFLIKNHSKATYTEDMIIQGREELINDFLCLPVVIRISNIPQEIASKLIATIEAIETEKLPKWLEERLKSLTEEEIWGNDYLQTYDIFIHRIKNKNWRFRHFKKEERCLELHFSCKNSSSFFDVITVAFLLGIDCYTQMEIDDPIFGVYSPK